ncbi:MAG: glycosyltransferase, partial [Proteobacteria bacterium]|nr:glycosyltransferase [Pseudomonadota bacterium]
MSIAERDREITEDKRLFFNDVFKEYLHPGPFKRYYNERLLRLIRFNVPRGASVLEIGCGVGDLLAALEPRRGLGIDFSEKMIESARARHPAMEFQVADAQVFKNKEKFDYVILSNLVGELVDVQRVFSRLGEICHERTRIIITYYNYLWGPFVNLAEQLKIKPRQREQNWLQIGDLANLLELAGIEPIKHGRSLLAPVSIPIVSNLVNNYLAPLPGLNRICVNELIVSRKPRAKQRKDCRVSVIVACKDERGNIEEIFRTLPKMGLGTELIFVDGHSEDGTVEEIERCKSQQKELNPELDSVRVFVQTGTGKGDAVRLGFEKATGDILMILDADITVRPEDLPKFYSALIEGKGEFINGTRLIYPMEDQAMRFLNMLANHLFGWTFSWLLDQRLTDTLCGTKVLFKSDYEEIKRGRSFFGNFDPFGDFDL